LPPEQVMVVRVEQVLRTPTRPVVRYGGNAIENLAGGMGSLGHPALSVSLATCFGAQHRRLA